MNSENRTLDLMEDKRISDCACGMQGRGAMLEAESWTIDGEMEEIVGRCSELKKHLEKMTKNFTDKCNDNADNICKITSLASEVEMLREKVKSLTEERDTAEHDASRLRADLYKRDEAIQQLLYAIRCAWLSITGYSPSATVKKCIAALNMANEARK